jgi:hypothetical protein
MNSIWNGGIPRKGQINERKVIPELVRARECGLHLESETLNGPATLLSRHGPAHEQPPAILLHESYRKGGRVSPITRGKR